MAEGTAEVYKWSTVDRLCNTAVTLTGNIALARLLSVDDFGLLAMVAIFSAIAYNISSCGMSDGLIKKLNPTREDYSTVFTFNSAMGVLFCVLFILGAKPMSRFFNQPQLVGIMWAIGICFVFQTLWFVQETRLRKELKMKKIAMVRISASVASVGLGITLALLGYGYWGLVSCRVFVSVFQFAFYVMATRWMPRIGFYRKSFNEMFGFGVNLMLSYLATQVSTYINSFILGKFSSVESGLYSQAQKLEDVPFRMVEAIFNWPFFAVLSNETDRRRRIALSRDMLRNISMTAFFCGMLMMLLAKPALNLLYGPKWDAAIPILRILVLFGIAATLKYFFQTIMKCHGLTNKIRNLTIVELGIQLGILAAVYRMGIVWIAWSQVVGLGLTLVAYAWFYRRLESQSLSTMLSDIFSSLATPAAAFAVTAAAYWMWGGVLPDWLNCICTTTLFMAICVAVWEHTRNPFYLRMRTSVLSRFHLKNNQS